MSDKLSDVHSARSRKFETLCRQTFAKIGGRHAGSAAGVSETKFSRFLSGGEGGLSLEEVCKAFVFAGLKIVPSDYVCVARDVFDSYKTLATRALTDPATLEWDEE